MQTEAEKRVAAAKERDAIKVTSNEVKEEEKKEEEVKEEEVEKEDDEKEEVKEEDVETKEEEIEAKEDEIEELKAEKKVSKSEREKERMQRRIDKLTAQVSEEKKERARVEAQLATKPDDEKAYTIEDVRKLAKDEAVRLRIEEEFNRACEKLAKDANKADKQFDKKVAAMAEEIGGIPSGMIGILEDFENGGAVLSYLTDNVDEAEEIYQVSPARMALKLSKISENLIAKEKAKGKKEISKVPEPNKVLGGKGETPEVLSDKLPTEDWIRIRNKQVAERQEAKRLGRSR